MSPRRGGDESISAQYSKKAENTSPPTTDQKNFTKSLLMAKKWAGSVIFVGKIIIETQKSL